MVRKQILRAREYSRGSLLEKVKSDSDQKNWHLISIIIRFYEMLEKFYKNHIFF